jgi:hypothetical protein
MESIKLRSRVGNDGILRIQVPDSFKNQNLEILVVFQPIAAPEEQFKHSTENTPEALGWSPGFFEKVVGSWEGEPLECPPQLPYEVRDELTFGEEAS